MAERKHGAKAPATESTVTGESWEGRDISGVEHTRVLFVNLDLTEVVDDGAVFTECIFRNAKLNCSSHTSAAFVNCSFTGCSFFDSRFTECKMVGSMFERCSFELMEVKGGNWSHVGLPSAKLDDATFSGVRMVGADLTGARCVGGKLRDVELQDAWLGRADLTDCDLRGSDLGAIEPDEVTLRGAIVTAEQAIAIAQAMGLDVRAE
ncbi:MAG: pentapeptide repeat-containing protein [bacterium]